MSNLNKHPSWTFLHIGLCLGYWEECQWPMSPDSGKLAIISLEVDGQMLIWSSHGK